jgi:high affinity Mn2+ porin
MPNESNSNEFDMNWFRRGSYVTELETRYSIGSQAGKLRVGVWANTYFAGSYSEALDLVTLNPGLDPTEANFQTRTGRTKYGYYLNVEQALTEQIGIFGR